MILAGFVVFGFSAALLILSAGFFWLFSRLERTNNVACIIPFYLGVITSFMAIAGFIELGGGLQHWVPPH